MAATAGTGVLHCLINTFYMQRQCVLIRNAGLINQCYFFVSYPPTSNSPRQAGWVRDKQFLIQEVTCTKYSKHYTLALALAHLHIALLLKVPVRILLSPLCSCIQLDLEPFRVASPFISICRHSSLSIQSRAKRDETTDIRHYV
jgi:hypothetical protein